MSIKSKDEILASIKAQLAEDTSDEALAILEDISDTFDDFENKAKGDGKDWKAEAQRIDKEWREKYRQRFFSTPEKETEPEEPEFSDEPKTLKFEDLFTKE